MLGLNLDRNIMPPNTPRGNQLITKRLFPNFFTKKNKTFH